MKYLFFVQGEGRGHLTQALALKERLEKKNHTVTGVIIGEKQLERVPAFFREALGCPLFNLNSPKFITDKNGKGIKLGLSIIKALKNLPEYLRALKEIQKIIQDLGPDVLVNFYEPLAGNYYRFYREERPMFCIGHQYFIKHPSFKFPPHSFLNQFILKTYNRFTAPKKTIKIALSFTEENDQTEKNLFVCPPLIRGEILKKVPEKQDFILVYLLNPGYYEEIAVWSQKHPEQKIKAFWNKPGPNESFFGDNLVFHKLDGTKFINYLAYCSGYAATAGFDSIAEAAYLQKDVLMIPTKNHFEQKCNAVDAQRAGLAIAAPSFDLSLLTNKQEKKPSENASKKFREWVDNASEKITDLLDL